MRVACLSIIVLAGCAAAPRATPSRLRAESTRPARSAPTAASTGAAAAPPSAGSTERRAERAETVEERASRLHRRAIVVDGHDDIPTVMLGSGFELGASGVGRTHTDLARMKAGGITGSFFSIYVEGELAEKPTVLGGGALRRALDLIDVTYREVERHPSELVLATSAADVRRAKRDGKIAILMGVEGGHAIENSLGALRSLYRLGCRYMTLTHSNTNEWADSSGFAGPPRVRHNGLAAFGEDVVREMQRIGMLVDVSHVSDETFWGVMRIAQAPVIASHSSARALADHRRNVDDEMLRAVAKNGGIVMVNFWSRFLSSEYMAAAARWSEKHGRAFDEIRANYKHDPLRLRSEVAKLRARTEPLPKVPLSVLVDHIEHVAKVAGIDHVGLGSDFDGVDALPEGIDGVDALPKITLELVRRGYKDDDVLKVLGENFLRVLEAAEAHARATSTRLSGDGSTRRLEPRP